MQTEANFYINEVDRIEIERLPKRGLVRVRIKGGSSSDTVALACWGRFDLDAPQGHVSPKIVETLIEDEEEDEAVPALAKPTEEPAHASDVASDANG